MRERESLRYGKPKGSELLYILIAFAAKRRQIPLFKPYLRHKIRRCDYKRCKKKSAKIRQWRIWRRFSVHEKTLFWLHRARVIYQSLQKNADFFCDCCGQKSLILRHVFLKNAMEYAGYFCNFMRWNCGNLQKLQFDEKEKKKIDSLGYNLNVQP